MNATYPKIMHFLLLRIYVKRLEHVVEKKRDQKKYSCYLKEFFAFIIKRIRLFQKVKKQFFLIHFLFVLWDAIAANLFVFFAELLILVQNKYMYKIVLTATINKLSNVVFPPNNLWKFYILNFIRNHFIN